MKNSKKSIKEDFLFSYNKMLYIYIMFVKNSPKFFLIPLQEIIIYKNNSIYTFLNPSFNALLFSLKSD